jgi:hypothetical protein
VNRNLAPGAADIVFLVVAPITAFTRVIRLTHSDGDLAAHIRIGREILSHGQIPVHSLVSVTATSDPFVAHAWLSEVIFAGLFALGGLAMITVFAALIIAATHASVARFLTSRGVDARWAVAAAFVSLSVSSTHWLARPHMFSLLGTALTLYLLESRGKWRVASCAVLFAAWSNLHGGWLFGLGMIGAWVAGALIESMLDRARRDEWRQRASRDAGLLAVAIVSVHANPYGWKIFPEVLGGALNPSLARQMAEFLPPDFLTLAPLPFVLGAVLSVVLLVISRQRMSVPHLILLLACLALGVRSFRAMALFGVSAWPLVALHAARTWPQGRRRFPLFNEVARLDPFTRPGLYALPVAIGLLLVGLNSGRIDGAQVIRDDFSPRIFPVAAVAKAQSAGLNDPVFESWAWGGYIMYAWPGAKLIVDPLEFSDSTVAAFARIDRVEPGWQGELDRWKIRTVLIRPSTPLDTALSGSSRWQTFYRDSTAVIFRPAPPL